ATAGRSRASRPPPPPGTTRPRAPSARSIRAAPRPSEHSFALQEPHGALEVFELREIELRGAELRQRPPDLLVGIDVGDDRVLERALGEVALGALPQEVLDEALGEGRLAARPEDAGARHVDEGPRITLLEVVVLHGERRGAVLGGGEHVVVIHEAHVDFAARARPDGGGVVLVLPAPAAS